MGITNYLFADGYIQSMKHTATGAPINLWNVDNTTNPGDANPGPADTDLLVGLGVNQAAMQ